MKIAILSDRQNFSRYAAADKLPADYELIFLDTRSPDENALIASGADMILVTPLIPVTASVIERMPNLKLIQSHGAGYEKIDLKAARKAGVAVANCAGVNAGAVAEQAILLMLAVIRNCKEFDRMVYNGQQRAAQGRCFGEGLRELCDLHVGLIGFGAIGQRTAELLRAFGCRISYYDCIPKPDCGFEACSMDRILSECDIVSLHLAVNPETIGIIGEREFSLMKPGSILINTARGELVDQDALCRSLISGRLSGAGLDVLSPEPVTADNPVLKLPENVRDRVVLSPHIGGLSDESFRKIYDIVWENARRLKNGESLLNIVN